jgi:hypothetical protein
LLRRHHAYASSPLPAGGFIFIRSIHPSVHTITEVTPCDPSMHAYMSV